MFLAYDLAEKYRMPSLLLSDGLDMGDVGPDGVLGEGP